MRSLMMARSARRPARAAAAMAPARLSLAAPPAAMGHDLRRVALLPPTVRRVVELRPPWRGEASAFDHAQDLVDRSNAVVRASTFRRDGRTLLYEARSGTPTAFERQMRAFVDRAEVLPMRLITSAGLSFGARVFVDEFVSGYVAMDDLLAGDDGSLQVNLVHILTERGRARNSARRIGTRCSRREFDRAHAAGIQSEAAVLQDVLGDPTLRFVHERDTGRSVSFTFRSDGGYRVVYRFAGSDRRAVRSGALTVQTADGRDLDIKAFVAERAAAAAAGP